MRIVVFGAWTAVAACRSHPTPARIGVAVPGWGQAVVPLVLEDLASERGLQVEFVSPPTPRAAPRTGGGAVAIRLAERLVEDDGVVAVVGHGGSRESLFAAAVYRRHRVVQVVPTGTSRLLRAAGPWTLTLVPDDSLEGIHIARYLTESVGARRLLVFFTNDEYGIGLRDGVADAVAVVGGEVVESVPIGAAVGFEAVVETSLRRADPDGIVVAGRPAEAVLVARGVARWRPGLPVVAGDGAAILPDDSAGRAVLEEVGVRVVGFWHPDRPDSASRDFVRRFRGRWGREPNASNALAYDAFRVVATAVRAAGSEPSAIRDYLVSLGASRPAMHGVTGAIAFGADRPASFLLLQVVGDRLVVDTAGGPR